jgi:hypothetical protein
LLETKVNNNLLLTKLGKEIFNFVKKWKEKVFHFELWRIIVVIVCFDLVRFAVSLETVTIVVTMSLLKNTVTP